MQNKYYTKENEEDEASIICKLCKLKGYSELVEILKLIAATPSLMFLKREYKKGVKVLMNALRFMDVYEILETSFRNGKKTEENFVISILIALPSILQAKLVSSIVINKVSFEPFFYSKLIDSLVIDGQLMNAVNVFFVFNFGQTSFLPDMNQFIERLFANDHPYLLVFYRLFSTKYFSNNSVFEEEPDTSINSLLNLTNTENGIEPESEDKDLVFNVDQYLSQFDNYTEGLIESSSYYNHTHSENNLDESVLTCDAEIMQTQTNKIFTDIDFNLIKNLKLEAEVCNKLILEFTKKL